MNYITLNGVKSTTISGLLIQSLPPVSKPKIRTQTEEIDGRDGDIVTTLGYAAYDRQITIGLYGSYDVDEVIAYFDAEGTAIFSNEPDKYYHFKILEQIDLERLIRFKTATVTFHVQPFKHSAVDGTAVFTKFSNKSIAISNSGNVYSKPQITIYGAGTVNLSINGYQAFVIALGNDEYITLDAAEMNAYKDNVLKNRLVTGDYDNLRFKVGKNTVSWTGTVTKVEISDYSRWI